MCHVLLHDRRFLALLRIDHDLAARTRADGCPCGGAPHRADYPRKPRAVRSTFESSILCACCSVCRRRATSMQIALQKVTTNTVVNRAALVRAIGECAANGFAVVGDQLSPGHGAVAVPPTSGRSRRFALAVSLSTGGYSKARLVRDVLPLLRDVKEKFERIIAKAADA